MITLESGEKRRVEKSRMPRPTKRSRSVAQLEDDLSSMGVEIPTDSDVSYIECPEVMQPLSQKFTTFQVLEIF